MTDKPRRVKLWKLLSILLLIAIPAGVGGYLWIESRISRKWARMQDRVRDLQAQAASRSRERPVLRGKPVPGNCWDDYIAAMELFTSGRRSAPVPDATRHPLDEGMLQWLESAGPALERWRKGLQRTQTEVPNASRKWYWPALTDLAAWKARSLQEKGQARDALDWSLALAEFAQDLARNRDGEDLRTSSAALYYSFAGIRRVLSSGSMNPSEFTELEIVLGRLDVNFPSFSGSLWNTVAHCGSVLLSRDLDLRTVGMYTELPSAGWRHAFSGRLMRCDAIARLESLARRVEESEPLSWAQSKARYEESRDFEVWKAGPLTEQLTRNHAQADHQRRDGLARLRLLRVGAYWRATGRVLDLEDPYGHRILTSESGGRLRAWSLGPDGVDQSGKGDWLDLTGGDIPLELDR